MDRAQSFWETFKKQWENSESALLKDLEKEEKFKAIFEAVFGEKNVQGLSGLLQVLICLLGAYQMIF